jgi:2-methylcitrate dehydratase PrpD
MPDGAARVTLRLSSGEILTETVTSPRGSQAAPLTDSDLEAKLREGVRTGRSDWDADRVIDAVWRLDAADDVGALLQSLRPPSASRQTISN